MDEKTIIFILLGICAFLFCFVFVVAILQENQTKKELSGQAGVYKGPAGEPRWNGQLPEKVDDYVCPRYVYENLVESTDYLPENGRIIGYRIAPDLVIHSRVQYCVNSPSLKSYILRLGGKLLTPDEVLTLFHNWKDVSALRAKAGDTTLGKFQFWCSSKEGFPVCSNIKYGDIILEDMVGFTKFNAPLILKR